MTTLNEGSTPAELTDQRDAAADGDVQGRNIQGPSVQGPKVQGPKVQGPMSQQAAFGSQGYDIYPQTFVQLVGCPSIECASRAAVADGGITGVSRDSRNALRGRAGRAAPAADRADARCYQG